MKTTNTTTTKSNLLSIFARPNESSCKKVTKANLSKANLSKAPPVVTNPTGYRTYSPKIRQQVISNKLLNSQLYDLYTVRKLHCVGKWLKNNIVDGTITIAKQTYIVSWLDIIPMDDYKEEEVVVNLRSHKYKDTISKEYSLSYAVVSKLSN